MLTDFGPNAMGIVVSMDIRPLTNISTNTALESLLRIRYKDRYELVINPIHGTTINTWWMHEGIGHEIFSLNTTQGNLLVESAYNLKIRLLESSNY